MIKHIAALAFIFICTSIAWMILGGTIFARTGNAGEHLRGEVASTWGAPLEQRPATACYDVITQKTSDYTGADGKKSRRTESVTSTVGLPLEATDASVVLEYEPRQKGLLWYSTYKVNFAAIYSFKNLDSQDRLVKFALKFPSDKAIYDDFTMAADGAPLAVRNSGGSAWATAIVPAGKTVNLAVGYHSQGLDSWTYSLGESVAQVKNFKLQMTTNFKDIDFPESSLSPTDKEREGEGWKLTWAYTNLLSGYHIEMPMPQELQPGPLAGEISLFAPVSLFFFFFLMFIITTLRGIELHAMNYFFLAAAFFAFHLLLAYLADHLALIAAFVICSAVSVFLVVSYLRLAVGMRFAAAEAGTAQLIYLVLFSYAFFFKGFTGLTVTIGAIITLFVVMQMTGRIKWAEKFAAKPPLRIQQPVSS